MFPISFRAEIQGYISLFGWGVSVSVIVSDEGLAVDADMDKIKLGGFLKVQRSKQDSHNGPKFHLLVAKNKFELFISGYVESILFTGGITIIIDSSHFEFELSTKFFVVFILIYWCIYLDI